MLRLLTAFVVAAFFTLPASAMTDFSKFTFESLDGGQLNLSDFDGKVLLVVNTATQCGNTHQMGSLQKAWEANRDQGLVIVGISMTKPGTLWPVVRRMRFCSRVVTMTHSHFGMCKRWKASGQMCA